MRLLSSHGEELDSATLFVHVTVTNLNDAVAVSIACGQFNPLHLTIKIIILLTACCTWPLLMVGEFCGTSGQYPDDLFCSLAMDGGLARAAGALPDLRKVQWGHVLLI